MFYNDIRKQIKGLANKIMSGNRRSDHWADCYNNDLWLFAYIQCPVYFGDKGYSDVWAAQNTGNDQTADAEND